jgi:hypothetical protein
VPRAVTIDLAARQIDGHRPRHYSSGTAGRCPAVPPVRVKMSRRDGSRAVRSA